MSEHNRRIYQVQHFDRGPTGTMRKDWSKNVGHDELHAELSVPDRVMPLLAQLPLDGVVRLVDPNHEPLMEMKYIGTLVETPE